MNRLSDEITNTLDSNKTFTHLSTIVKELIENSIDANAKKISATISENGLDFIEIKDDGTGMSKNILEKLCERFSSTKINTYDDLTSINTFGFRGEALSIISYISTLKIITRNKESEIGFEATYKNGKLVDKIKNIPIQIGTIIKIENIFYNNTIRKNFFEKNKNFEIENIIDTISKIAFHYILINFNVFLGEKRNQIFSTFTQFNNNNDNNKITKEDELIIRKKLTTKLFNQELKDDLFKFDNFSNEENKNLSDKNIENINKNFKYECYYTKPSSFIKKSRLILFVNNRLVKNNLIKKIFDQTYLKFLIKKGNYFAYLNITCPSDMIDINVSANKEQIFFLNEDLLFEHFQNNLEKHLQIEIQSKNYYVGSYNGFKLEDKDKEKKIKDGDLIYNDNSEKKNLYAKEKVRVDNNTVSIERFLSLTKIDSKKKNSLLLENKNNDDIKENINHNNLIIINNKIFKGILENIFNNKENCNINLTNLFKNGAYVGYESETTFIFLQFGTSLFIINAKLLMQEYFIFTILNNNINFIEKIEIKDYFNLNELLDFIYENFEDKKEIANNLKENIDFIQNNIYLDLIKFTEGIFIFENSQLKYFNILNFFNNENIINIFISYIPLIIFSILEYLFNISQNKNNNNFIQENTNLNNIFEIIKIYSFYHSIAYLDLINQENNDFQNKFCRDIILYNIKNEKNFFIRKNIKENSICEKIIDTETLYTVFERC